MGHAAALGISFAPDFDFLSRTVADRLQKNAYVPLATEANGVCQIIFSSGLIVWAGSLWARDACRGETTFDYVGMTPKAWTIVGVKGVGLGICHVAAIPCRVWSMGKWVVSHLSTMPEA